MPNQKDISSNFLIFFLFASVSLGVHLVKPKPYPSKIPILHDTTTIDSTNHFNSAFTSNNTHNNMFTSSTFPFHTPILQHHRDHHILLSSTRTHSPLTFHHSLTPSFLHPPPLLQPPTLSLRAKPPTADKSGEQKWVHEGLITESLPNGMFRVRLDNEDLILGYVSGKIRKNFVRILPGDRVKVEVSRYDSSKGRIVYRLRSSSGSSSTTPS